jgi:hypothetical protein
MLAFHYWGEQKFGREVIDTFFKILRKGFALTLEIPIIKGFQIWKPFIMGNFYSNFIWPYYF